MNESTSKIYKVFCGESVKQRECSGDEINLLHRDVRDITANVTFGYEKFVQTPDEIPERIIDLLQIASYVFCADRMASRGDRKSITNVGWSRSFHFTIPVSDIDFWNTDAVKKALNDTLAFMTGDRKYEFSFVKESKNAVSTENVQLSLFNTVESEIASATDADVMLFSGGLDSLAGAIERLSENPARKLCLVSHKSNTTSISIQNKLTEELKKSFGDRIIKYGFECRNKGMKTREETQRTRMFLFSAIAFAICGRLQKNELLIYENGVTSINIPIQVDTINARASRTTHPKTIGLLERFYKLLNSEFKIVTPYRANTKAEIIEKFRTYNALGFIASSVSCSSTRSKPQGTPHCGVCSQCIDRKFSVYSVGLDDEDDRYETDFIIGENDNELRNRLLGLLMFANKIKGSTPFELWGHSPTDFFDIVSYWGQHSNPDDNMTEIYALLNRFADSVWSATKAMVAKNFSPQNAMNSHSLLRIITSQEYLGSDITGGSTQMERDEIFISYAHVDNQYIDELKPFLSVLARDKKIEYWYDGMIPGGAKFEDKIQEHLSRAKIALLLVSQNFIASDFIHNKELPTLMAAAEKDGAVVLWLPISHCVWNGTIIADYQSAAGTNPNNPLAALTLNERNAVYTKLSEEIMSAFR